MVHTARKYTPPMPAQRRSTRDYTHTAQHSALYNAPARSNHFYFFSPRFFCQMGQMAWIFPGLIYLPTAGLTLIFLMFLLLLLDIIQHIWIKNEKRMGKEVVVWKKRLMNLILSRSKCFLISRVMYRYLYKKAEKTQIKLEKFFAHVHTPAHCNIIPIGFK